MNLVALQFQTTLDFEQNLITLLELLDKTDNNSIIVAPELCLNGYAYDRLDEAVQISQQAITNLLIVSQNKTIVATFTTQENGNYFNTLHIFHKGHIVHTQSKYQLFVLNDEKKHFTQGRLEDIKIIEIDGIKIAAMICFELRFIELWQKLQGADIICIPSMWGFLRKENFETLTQGLAVMNQCYVIASDSSNDDMASRSGIITPFGVESRDDDKNIIEQRFESNEIKKMRRYMNVGIK